VENGQFHLDPDHDWRNTLMQKPTGQASALGGPSLASLSIDNRWLLQLLYVSLFVVAAWPVLSVTVPPLVDYPNHLARAHILTAWNRVPALQQNYIVDWALHPNMSFDVLMLPLTKWLSIYDAGRAFILLTMFVIVGGTCTLHKVLHGRIGLWPVVTYLFLFNHAFFWGLVAYLFTAGLGLFAVSGWIYWRERARAFRILLFSITSLVLFFGHLFGLLAYAIAVVGYEIWRTFPGRPGPRELAADWSVTAAQFVLPCLLFLHWIVQNRALGQASSFYGTIEAKLIALISPVYFGMPLIDVPTVVFAGIVLVWCRRRKGLAFAQELRVPVLLMAVAALLMPHVLSDVWQMDTRLPIVLACMLVAGTRCEPEIARSETTIASIAVFVIVLRSIVITDAWQSIDRQFDEFRSASSVLENGASLLTVEDPGDVPPTGIERSYAIYWHMSALGVIERSMFYPCLFTGHTSVDVSTTRKPIDTPSGTPISRALLAMSTDPASTEFTLGQRLNRYHTVFWDGWPNTFDYVLNVRFDNPTNPAPKHLKRVESGSFFDLYEVVPDTSP
jgi:hypothetical protein